MPFETTFGRGLKGLIRLFNFSMWEAYGEAEAECAMLERLGYVDMVFTGDSDVLLFGARRVVRHWPSKRNEPLSCYDQTWITDMTGWDRSDLILVALLRGCDYDTSGTRGVGIGLSGQLAKCHFHRALMDDIQRFGRETPLDEERVQHLFDSLTYELHNNSTKNLNRRRNVDLDSKFFDFSIVQDFIHPKTNIGIAKDEGLMTAAKELEANLDRRHEPDWVNLAAFAQLQFKWPADYVLKRFSALLYPGYMANSLRRRRIPTVPIHPLRTSSSVSNSQPSRVDRKQRTLDEFYRATPRLHQMSEKGSDLVQISGSKIASDNIKLYRVEWDKSSWETFQNRLKLNLDFQAFRHDVVIDDDDDEAVECGEMVKTDPFLVVKRQWVDAAQIHRIYPAAALKYQNRPKKSVTARQSMVDSFLVLPPKRRK
ncbi:uncharacterized protein EV154DRAFT_524967 [Mucor mucedo]|uniref:uncharacterized protein n=1 Tax=Mucor mucedo TaxID=29922 RepID=UPI00221F6327|nr:uncharacterized protein EV154DRAFT_524967 [Mucor mucedo]KAI7878739.1 hypothetical protein EV154DRAFT_524967 [Mucor mucedo]